MAMGLRCGEPVRAMVSAFHKVADENARLSAPDKSPLQANRGTVQGVARLVDMSDRHTLLCGTNVESINVFVIGFTYVCGCSRPGRR
jgi:hypothetical protein